MMEGGIFVPFAKSTALRRFSNITLLKFSAKLDTAFNYFPRETLWYNIVYKKHLDFVKLYHLEANK